MVVAMAAAVGFFFSSRRRHTRCGRDWSSDVCSSDLLATPASVQSVPTEGNQEDVVPMGMSAAWKAERIVANAARIVAIELLAGAQGLEYLKPLRPGRGVARMHAAVRREGAALDGDRPLTADIERIAGGVHAGRFDPEASGRALGRSARRGDRLERCGGGCRRGASGW